MRSNTASRTLPVKSQSYRKKLNKNSVVPKKPTTNAKTTTKTITKQQQLNLVSPILEPIVQEN